MKITHRIETPKAFPNQRCLTVSIDGVDLYAMFVKIGREYTEREAEEFMADVVATIESSKLGKTVTQMERMLRQSKLNVLGSDLHREVMAAGAQH